MNPNTSKPLWSGGINNMYTTSATNKDAESYSCGFCFIFRDGGEIKKGLSKSQSRVKLVLAHS